MKIKTLIYLIIGAAFFTGADFAMAGVGISPVSLQNSSLYPGAVYEQIIYFLRSDNEPSDRASIAITDPTLASWISTEPGPVVMFPASEVRVPVTFRVKVPDTAVKGSYNGKLKVIFGGSGQDQHGITPYLGARIDVSIRIIDPKLRGKILLQTEDKGRAWYVYPKNYKRYYLGRPADAFQVMSKLGLGVEHEFIAGRTLFPDNALGMILLDVEDHGKAYYINPADGKAYYLKKPQDAFAIMGKLGLGITNRDIDTLEIGVVR